METAPKIKGAGRSRAVRFSATLGQLKTLVSGKITVTLSADSGELSKILELMSACQKGDSLSISAKVIKAKPNLKKDAKEKPNTQNQKGPRRVRRYPYRD